MIRLAIVPHFPLPTANSIENLIANIELTIDEFLQKNNTTDLLRLGEARSINLQERVQNLLRQSMITLIRSQHLEKRKNQNQNLVKKAEMILYLTHNQTVNNSVKIQLDEE